MKKRMVSLLLACCLVLALLPTMASASEPKYVQVSGTEVSGGGYWKINESTGELTNGSSSDYNVGYDVSRQTLTLNNATITRSSWSKYGLSNGVTKYNGLYAGIHTDGSIYIKLIGDNTVNVYSATDMFTSDCAGIAAANESQSIEFTGDGNLLVQGGRTTKNSFGVVAGSSVVMSGTGKVEIYASVSGSDKISAGIYLLGTLDDMTSRVVPRSGSLTAGTSHGGAASYGVYGKTELSYFNQRETYGEFTAYCNVLAETAVALSTTPMYLPLGHTALVARTGRAESGELVAYRAEDNGLYTYVRLLRDLDPGADVQGLTEKSHTSCSITMNAAAIKGTNPGNQVVEYAVGQENNTSLPTAGWQTSPVFDGLAPNGRYWVWARTAATTTRAAGAAIHSETICTTPDGNAGLYVNGIGIDKSQDLPETDVGGGKMRYDKATRTLTFSGDVEITHGYTVPQGQMIGIFSNAELHIVLESGTNLTIDVKNYERDMALTKSLEKSHPISGQCYGIFNYGDLTIDAAENCEITPTLTVNVLGAGYAAGIYAKEVRDPSSAVLEDGDLTIGAVNTNITVRGMSGPATLNPSIASLRQDGYPGVTGISSGDDITFNGVTGVDAVSSTQYHVQTVGGYSGHLFTAGATGYGVVQMNGGYVYAENNGRNGNYRISYNTIKWALGYTCTDSEGNRVEMKDAYWVNGSAAFDPNGEPVLKGDLVISGTLEKDYKLTATIKNGNLSSSDRPIYQWYRYRYGTETAISGAVYATYSLSSADVDYQIYCVVTCDGFAGSLVSEKTDKISAGPDIPTVYIAGVQLTKLNAADVLKDSGVSYEGKISYDPVTNILTLDNVTLSETGDKSAIIFSDGDYEGFTINLIGENTLSTTVEGKMAISCEAVMFTGDGSLYARADYPNKATIHAPWQMDVGGNCSIVTSCINNNNVYDSNFSDMARTETGALNAGDLNVSGNSSIYAYVDDGEDGNSKCTAIDVSYVTTIKDNATVVAKGSRHEAFITGYLSVEGGSVKAENVGTGYQFIYGKNKDRVKIETDQYPALKVTYLYLKKFGITTFPNKLTISNAKLEIYSELGYGILEQETEDHDEKINGEWQVVHTNIVDNFEIYNSTVIVRIGAKAASIAPIKMEDKDGGTIIADDCTVYAGTDETGANATLSTKDAFLTKGSRYVRLIAGSAVDVGTKVTESEAETTVTADIAAGPKSEKEASVLIVRFNAAGKFAGLKYQTAVLSGKTWTIEASFANPQPGDTYKVYVLDGTRYVPMRNAALVHLK